MGFPGHPISAAQWVIFIFSFITVPFYILAFNSIRRPKPTTMVLFSYLYFFDTLLTIVFTIYFSVFWFTHADKHENSGSEEEAAILDVRDINVPQITTNFIAATPTASVLPTATSIYLPSSPLSSSPGLSTSAIPTALSTTTTTTTTTSVSQVPPQSATPEQEMAYTIVLTIVLVLTRVYFNFVILSYARFMIRAQGHGSSSLFGKPNDSTDSLTLNDQDDLSKWQALENFIAKYSVYLCRGFWFGKGYSRTPTGPYFAGPSHSHLNLTTMTDDDLEYGDNRY